MRKIAPYILWLTAACGVAAAGDWPTFGGDAQRTGWAKDEILLNKDNVKSMELNWKLHLENELKELHSLTVPIVAQSVVTNRGRKDLVIVAGSSDNLFAVDADSGKIVWQKKFEAQGTSRSKVNWLCSNALNATPTVQGGRDKTIYTIASDGRLHVLNALNGEDRLPPVQFVPPYSKNWSLSIVDNVLYTTISQGCNGAKSGVYSMDLNAPDRPISFFQSDTAGGGIWGRGGAAIGVSGEIFAETGDGPWDPALNKYADTFLGLSPKTLKLVDYYTPANREWITRKDLDMGNTTPVVFRYQGRELLVGAGKEGALFLLDTSSLGGEDHRQPLYRSPLYANEDVDFAGRGFWGAFASWEDAKGTRWVYAPAWGPKHTKAPEFPVTHGDAPNGSIMAFKVELKEGKPVLSPAWMSRDLNVPEPPIVANGIVYAISSGENVRQVSNTAALLTSQERAGTSGTATLYAFDAETGKELFSSRKTVGSFTHFGGLAIANGRVFTTAYDCVLYAFGLKHE
jgi:outer membrane protein assembly factor BamB